MPESPIRAVLDAIDALDVDRAAFGFAPSATLTMIYGQSATGLDRVRQALAELFGELRSTHHDVTAEWNPEPGIWIAEVTATYELRDYARLGPYRRAIVLREGADGIDDLAIYGAHELPLSQSERPYQEVSAGRHWLPTL